MTMSHDVNTKQCKICGELKLRIQYGTFGNSRNKRWVDSEGKLWNGHKCPDCQVKSANVNMKALRTREKQNA